jgi:hypothetical protein
MMCGNTCIKDFCSIIDRVSTVETWENGVPQTNSRDGSELHFGGVVEPIVLCDFPQ